MKTRTPLDLLFDQLKDLHSAEHQLDPSFSSLEALAIHAPLLVIVHDLGCQPRPNMKTIEAIFSKHDRKLKEDECKAMSGLIKGGDAHLADVGEIPVRDLMLVAHCLRIEHYKVAGYGIAARLAELLGFKSEASALNDIINNGERGITKLQGIEGELYEIAA